MFPKWRRTCLIAPPARLGRSRATGERLSGHRPNGQAFRQTAEREVVWLAPEPHRFGDREKSSQGCRRCSVLQALTQPGSRVMRSCATRIPLPRIGLAQMPGRPANPERDRCIGCRRLHRPGGGAGAVRVRPFPVRTISWPDFQLGRGRVARHRPAVRPDVDGTNAEHRGNGPSRAGSVRRRLLPRCAHTRRWPRTIVFRSQVCRWLRAGWPWLGSRQAKADDRA